MATSPYTLHTLENGLRVVIERMPHVRSAAAGFLVLTGARDETPELAGVSHFLEHMIFKGTPKRTWQDITLTFDRMGSSYNAFTSEDRTVFYGWVRTKDLEEQMELLADMMQSVLPEGEFQTERNVVLEEIAQSKDSLEHVAFDFLQEKIFAGHPLAWPILGYDQTIRNLSRDQMLHYMQRRYVPQNMMLIVTGNVDPQQVVDVAQRLCGRWTGSISTEGRIPPTIRSGADSLCVDRFKQQIIALTFASAPAAHRLAESASAAATILGGDNSRFFWNIMQTGISPRCGASYLGYTDCGLMALYGSAEPENVETLYQAMATEAQRIVNESVQPREVQRVKIRRRTSLAIESEAPYYRLTQLMDDMEHRGRPRTVSEMLAEVDAVSNDSIAEYFRDFPMVGVGHFASVGPRDWKPGR